MYLYVHSTQTDEYPSYQTNCLVIYKVPEALNTFNERHAVRAIYKSTAWFLLLFLDSFEVCLGLFIKVRKFQNENMRSSHRTKYEQKNSKNSALKFRAEFFQSFHSYFEQCYDFIISFWNFLTFKGTIKCRRFVQVDKVQVFK